MATASSPPSGDPLPRHGVPDWWMLGALGGIWGITFPVAHWGIVGGAPPFLLLAISLAIATAVMLPIALVRAGPRPTGRFLAQSAVLGGILIGMNNALLFWGVQYATGGLAAVVYAASPILTVLVALALGLGVRIGPLGAVALALGLLGVVAIDLAAAGTSLLANGWAFAAILGGVTSEAAGAVLVQRYRPNGETPAGQAAQFAGAGAVALLALLATGSLGAPFAISLTTVAAAVYFGGGSVVVGYTLFFRLVHRSGPVSSNLVNYVSPLVALAVGALLLGEPFGTPELLGLAMVLVALAVFHEASRPRRTRPRPVDEGPRLHAAPPRA